MQGDPPPRYGLQYWPVMFRGQFVRATLAHADAPWDEADIDAVADAMSEDPEDQPVPFMGPPVLTDRQAGVTLAQMPAILDYLARVHGLMPGDPARDALTRKVVADANDVLMEMTRHNGAQMWTAEAWAEYGPRLSRWMAIFDETGRRHGLTEGGGTLLGTEAPGLADLVSHVLWGTMTDTLPALRPLLERTAPTLAALSDRIGARPEQAALRARSVEAWGEAWCGGQIEASLRAAIAAQATG
ncbi:glutathione S-transferase [Rhodovulum sp. 12E13]|uniref:glutathione S-transferase n=1 Tax=Rhodovulum sp. 12E13 TaxID=2203891 RepID=UPI000E1AACD2|nr:glutathione S-transferase [Rhodovulum sp. 12E13]RDC71150.1 glutathione S-transferase [Rhodovulum sp. 12E13]